MSFFTDNHVVFFELLDGSVGDYVSSAENVAEFVAAIHFKSWDRAVVLRTVLRSVSIGSVAINKTFNKSFMIKMDKMKPR